MTVAEAAAPTSGTGLRRLLLLPLFALMIIESRRLAIRFVWVYIVLGLIAVGVVMVAITPWTLVR